MLPFGVRFNIYEMSSLCKIWNEPLGISIACTCQIILIPYDNTLSVCSMNCSYTIGGVCAAWVLLGRNWSIIIDCTDAQREGINDMTVRKCGRRLRLAEYKRWHPLSFILFYQFFGLLHLWKHNQNWAIIVFKPRPIYTIVSLSTSIAELGMGTGSYADRTDVRTATWVL